MLLGGFDLSSTPVPSTPPTRLAPAAANRRRTRGRADRILRGEVEMVLVTSVLEGRRSAAEHGVVLVNVGIFTVRPRPLCGYHPVCGKDKDGIGIAKWASRAWTFDDGDSHPLVTATIRSQRSGRPARLPGRRWTIWPHDRRRQPRSPVPLARWAG